jgi:hypothetical protein
MPVGLIPLGEHAVVRIELVAVAPNGPYRLTVEHPAKRLVEYFESPFDALHRWADIEAAFSGRHDPVMASCSTQKSL